MNNHFQSADLSNFHESLLQPRHSGSYVMNGVPDNNCVLWKIYPSSTQEHEVKCLVALKAYYVLFLRALLPLYIATLPDTVL